MKIKKQAKPRMPAVGTKNKITWCLGCTNFLLLEAVKKALARIIASGVKQEDIAIATGIGCHGKIFDYLNVSGIYALHGRVIPTAIGMKLGNKKLNVLGFEGDGDAYAEGMEHFIHAGRLNPDMTLIVHDNRAFSLTTGQAAPTSQQCYKSKAQPFGEPNKPINPIKLALASNASFIARCNARDIEHTAEIIEKAIKHKGFSFVEVLQECIIFNTYPDSMYKAMYKIQDNKDKKKAEDMADEWNYNIAGGKIPIGIIYQEEARILEDKLEEKRCKD